MLHIPALYEYDPDASVAGDTLELEVRTTEKDRRKKTELSGVYELAEGAMAVRRRVHQLIGCDRVGGLRSRIDRLTLRIEKAKAKRRKKRKKAASPFMDAKEEAWYYENLERLERLGTLRDEAERTEDEFVATYIARTFNSTLDFC